LLELSEDKELWSCRRGADPRWAEASAETLIDELTRECLALRVARRINSFVVIDTMADVMLAKGVLNTSGRTTAMTEDVRNWFARLGARTLYIAPGSHGNRCCELISGKLDDVA
jgi:hypothetical protein